MSDPFGGGFDPRIFENVPLFRELAKVMSWSGGPVNWDLAQQTARSLVSGSTPRSDRDAGELTDAVHVAELWLDAVLELEAVDGPVRAMTELHWVHEATTASGLGVLIEPVANGMRGALERGLPEQLQSLTSSQPGLGGAMHQAVTAMGAMMYGVQVGTIAGNLASDLLGTYDLGVPTIDARTVATVGTALQRFAEGYDFEPTELRYWLALREAAYRRLFVGVPWLRPYLGELIEHFASQAEFNPETLMDQLGGAGLDPSDVESLSDALGGSAFTVEPTEGQQRVLTRLQELIAFVGSWVDVVVQEASGGRLGALDRIEEAMRRRQAEHGPGERVLAQLIGLDLKPRDRRQARAFCEAVLQARGQPGLDRAWQRAEHLPRSDELADPSRWLVRMAAAELG